MTHSLGKRGMSARSTAHSAFVDLQALAQTRCAVAGGSMPGTECTRASDLHLLHFREGGLFNARDWSSCLSSDTVFDCSAWQASSDWQVSRLKNDSFDRLKHGQRRSIPISRNSVSPHGSRSLEQSGGHSLMLEWLVCAPDDLPFEGLRCKPHGSVVTRGLPGERDARKVHDHDRLDSSAFFARSSGSGSPRGRGRKEAIGREHLTSTSCLDGRMTSKSASSPLAMWRQDTPECLSGAPGDRPIRKPAALSLSDWLRQSSSRA